jgi:hypothetical protein
VLLLLFPFRLLLHHPVNHYPPATLLQLQQVPLLTTVL